MELLDKIPFISGKDDSTESEEVRYLGKFDSIKPDVDNFNRWVQESIEEMNRKSNNPSVVLDSNMKEEIDLDHSHLTYRIGIQDGEAKDDNKLRDTDQEITEGTTFKVILRSQPTPGVEVRGPEHVAGSYLESMKSVIDEETEENPDFTGLVAE